MYSLGLNNAPRISFTLIKLRVKNMQRFKQPVSRCKIVGIGFHSIAKLACTPRIATMNMAILLIAKVRSLNLRADCHRPELSTWFILGLRAGVGNPQSIGKLFDKELLLLWQSAE
jgi:hypothetical protein